MSKLAIVRFQNFGLDVIEEALILYENIYWEFAKPTPDKKCQGIRVNPITGHKIFGTSKIDDDIFDYLVVVKELLEVDAAKNYKVGRNYFVFYTLRKEVQKLAKQEPPHMFKYREKTLTVSQKIDKQIDYHTKHKLVAE